MARARSEGLGATSISPVIGVALWMLAGATGVKSVIEVGIGVGVSTLWTLAGMPTEGVLVTIDSEAQIHQITCELLSCSGISLVQVRMITGRTLQVSPRMSRRAYGMAVIDANPQET